MNKEQYKTYLHQRLNEAKLEWGMGPGNVYDAGKLFGTGGRFDQASPSAPKELSAIKRFGAAKKPETLKPETLKTELGTGYTIDSQLHRSKDANTESATQTPDGAIMSFHNELLTHTALDGVTKKDRMVPLHIVSEPLLGDEGYKTEFTIYTSKDGRPIHRYIRDEEEQGLIDEPVGHFADPVIDEETEERPGHTSYPQSQLRITHLHAENIINDHLNNTIRNGKSKGLSVAEHHGIDLDW
jgi:hypothetical protein